MRRAHSQVPTHLSHQLFCFLRLFPGKRFKILFPQHLNSAIGRSLWIRVILIVLFVNTLIRTTGPLALAHLSPQVLTLLLVSVHVLRQSLAL